MDRLAYRGTMTPPADPLESVHFGLAGPDDDEGMRRLLRQSPMPGRIRLTLEREPSIFDAGSIEGDRHQVIVARGGTDGRVVGMGSRSVRKVYVNGQVGRLGYLGQLRCDPACLGRKSLLAEGLAMCRQLHRPDELPYDLTSIITDNRIARGILTRGLKGLPIYSEFEPVVTLMLPVRRRRTHSESPRQNGTTLADSGRLGDLASCLQRNLRRYQFAPYWAAEDVVSSRLAKGLQLRDFHLAVRGGQVAGCLAVWDQRQFKQVVVRGYESRLQRWRHLINLAARLVGRPALPPPGSQLRIAYLSHLAVDEDDASVFKQLLLAACNDAATRGLDHLVIGMAGRNPLLDVVREHFPCHEYMSMLYLVHWGDAELEIRRLDGRMPHVEVAVL